MHWQVPCHHRHNSNLETHREIIHCVWLSVCCPAAEVVYPRLSSVSVLDARLKNTGYHCFGQIGNIHQNATLHPRWQTQSRMAAFQGSAGFSPGHKEHINRYGIEWFSVTSRWWTKAVAVSWEAPCQGKAVGCEVVKQAVILYRILTFINHACLWVNSQLHRFNKRHAGRPRHSVCLIYSGVREIIMEILRGGWTLITAPNKSRGDMKIDRRFSPSRLQVECGIETTVSVRTSQVILLLEGDSDYAG